MENRNKFWKGVLVGALVTAFAGLIIVGMSAGIFLIGRSVIYSQSRSQTAQGEEGKSGIDWNRVVSKGQFLQSYIEEYFLFDEDLENVEESIYKGLMSGLEDDYSTYYTPEEFKDLMEETRGEYCGIGAMVSKNMTTGVVSIVKVFKNTPAEEAGLMAGDVFYQIDDLKVTGDMDLDILVSQYVKGEEGTTVHLKMYRPSISDYVEMDVERRQVEVQTVEYEMKDDHLGYISVSQFEDNTTEQFMEAIEDLEEQGMEGMIIDLRGNPGGILDTAVAMLDYLLPDDLTQYSKDQDSNKDSTLLVSMADKNGEGDSYYCSDGHSVDCPIVILVDGNSASASEVFSGAMKDYGRAALVGTTTFGKGIVQTVFSLQDGSAIKITTAHYYSPSGFDLHGIGITPDVEIAYEIPERLLNFDSDEAASSGGVIQLTDEDDNQLMKAKEVLQEMIGGADLETVKEEAAAEKDAAENAAGAADTAENGAADTAETGSDAENSGNSTETGEETREAADEAAETKETDTSKGTAGAEETKDAAEPEETAEAEDAAEPKETTGSEDTAEPEETAGPEETQEDPMAGRRNEAERNGGTEENTLQDPAAEVRAA